MSRKNSERRERNRLAKMGFTPSEAAGEWQGFGPLTPADEQVDATRIYPEQLANGDTRLHVSATGADADRLAELLRFDNLADLVDDPAPKRDKPH